MESNYSTSYADLASLDLSEAIFWEFELRLLIIVDFLEEDVITMFNY